MVCSQKRKVELRNKIGVHNFGSGVHNFGSVQTYSGIIEEHTHAYSEASASLAYSKPWRIPITKHI